MPSRRPGLLSVNRDLPDGRRHAHRVPELTQEGQAGPGPSKIQAREACARNLPERQWNPLRGQPRPAPEIRLDALAGRESARPAARWFQEAHHARYGLRPRLARRRRAVDVFLHLRMRSGGRHPSHCDSGRGASRGQQHRCGTGRHTPQNDSGRSGRASGRRKTAAETVAAALESVRGRIETEGAPLGAVPYRRAANQKP